MDQLYFIYCSIPLLLLGILFYVGWIADSAATAKKELRRIRQLLEREAETKTQRLRP